MGGRTRLSFTTVLAGLGLITALLFLALSVWLSGHPQFMTYGCTPGPRAHICVYRPTPAHR